MSEKKRKFNTLAIAVLLLITVVFSGCSSGGSGNSPAAGPDPTMFSSQDRGETVQTADTVVIRLTGDGAEISGSGASFVNGNVCIAAPGSYTVSGTLDNGTLLITSESKGDICLLFDGASISCETNAAVDIEEADKVILTLAEGTENRLYSGKNAVNGSVDGTVYSRDDLTINGTGSLSVVSDAYHGIVCNDTLCITGGTITVEAVQDGLHAHDSIRFCDANLTVNAGDDGITASNDEGTSFIYIESGSISVPSCYEGIEANTVTICGGTINIQPTDDGINANGERGSLITISGGNICIVNPTGRDADGFDSNGDIVINGGNILISVSDSGGSCAIDFGSESGGSFTINGGTLIACGSTMMAESPSSASTQGFLMKTSQSNAAGTEIALTAADGTELIRGSVPCAFSSVILSSPDMEIGKTYTLTLGSTSAEITVDNRETGNSGFGGRGGFEGGGRDDRFPGRPGGNAEIPEMPGGFGGNGEMPDIPGGFGGNGEMPDIPGGFGGNGQPPEMPGNVPGGKEPGRRNG